MQELSLNDKVEMLNLDSKTLNILLENNIFKIEDLWKLKRNELKKIGLNDNQISNSIVKLQLNGIDLNCKKNTKDVYIKK